MKRDLPAMLLACAALLTLMLVLSACGGVRLTGPSVQTGGYVGSPIARATNGATASFSMTTCTASVAGARVVEETLLQLNQQGVLSLADGEGTTTRVVLNLCGAGAPVVVPPARTPAGAR